MRTEVVKQITVVHTFCDYCHGDSRGMRCLGCGCDLCHNCMIPIDYDMVVDNGRYCKRCIECRNLIIEEAESEIQRHDAVVDKLVEKFKKACRSAADTAQQERRVNNTGVCLKESLNVAKTGTSYR